MLRSIRCWSSSRHGVGSCAKAIDDINVLSCKFVTCHGDDCATSVKSLEDARLDEPRFACGVSWWQNQKYPDSGSFQDQEHSRQGWRRPVADSAGRRLAIRQWSKMTCRLCLSTHPDSGRHFSLGQWRVLNDASLRQTVHCRIAKIPGCGSGILIDRTFRQRRRRCLRCR